MGVQDLEAGATMLPEAAAGLREEPMVREDRWQEIRRLHEQERLSVSEIGRRLDLDRKTVRRCLRDEKWEPYRRAARAETMLTPFLEGLRERVAEVKYSAQVLFQELRKRGYEGSYETVKRFVQPLRDAELLADRATVRFETEPGEQSQIDWGSSRVYFRHEPVVLHLFILTLGYCRRSFYDVFRNEQMPQFLDAHERAFEHFGGHTQEHLYDRMRTVCQVNAEGRATWNPTFRSFADYWGFEPRLCRPYRAQTKGKIEAGVKYVRRNFLCGLQGREPGGLTDFNTQLREWVWSVANQRVHGTTHECVKARWDADQRALHPTNGRLPYPHVDDELRKVARDAYVAWQGSRYSVPWQYAGKEVWVREHGHEVEVRYNAGPIATHRPAARRHEVVRQAEHHEGIPLGTERRGGKTLIQIRERAPEVETRLLDAYERVALEGVL